MFKISIKDPRDDSYWMYTATPQWAARHDNGVLVSIGLRVGEESLKAATFDRMKKARVGLKRISRDEWNHSSCQSSCTQRGDKACRW